jgi:SAM-dependent methyltransferase
MNQDYKHLMGEDYERLYSKYLIRPSRLLVAPDPAVALDKDTRLLDLCSGSGAVVKAAMEMGVAPGNIVAVEESQAMSFELHRHGAIHVVHGNLEYLGLYDMLAKHGLYDLITCRQAVNYWWNSEIVERIVRLLAEEGCFVFNTFNTPPAEVPQTKQYVHDGVQFAEIAYRIDDIVHHVQAREGMPMHLTTFRWIEPVEYAITFDDLKSRGMIAEWSRAIDGTTDTYVCRA